MELILDLKGRRLYINTCFITRSTYMKSLSSLYTLEREENYTFIMFWIGNISHTLDIFQTILTVHGNGEERTKTSIVYIPTREGRRNRGFVKGLELPHTFARHVLKDAREIFKSIPTICTILETLQDYAIVRGRVEKYRIALLDRGEIARIGRKLIQYV